jgi:hypothetical protein
LQSKRLLVALGLPPLPGMPDDVNPAAKESMNVYDPAPVVREQHAEGGFTRVIEQQTAKIPSSAFLVAAIASMIASAALELSGQTRWSRFVGMWTPTLLITGVYNKMVKTFGPR